MLDVVVEGLLFCIGNGNGSGAGGGGVKIDRSEGFIGDGDVGSSGCNCTD